MSQAPIYISAEKVKSVLTWPLVNHAVEEALKAVGQVTADPSDPSISYASQPPRSVTKCGNADQTLFTMPSYVGNFKLEDASDDISDTRSTIACKLVTSFPENEQRSAPLPNILANILLFSTKTGELEAILDATQITAWRTAAASIVATKYLYFKRFAAPRRPIRVAIIGCGVQGQSHALGMCATFDVSEITLWNRTASKAEALANKLQAHALHTQVHVAQSPAEAVAEADVICVGTFAAHALIDLEMLHKQNVHINTVGAGQVHFGEVAQNIYDKANVYVDSMTSAKIELKDLKANIVAEVGQIIKSANYPQTDGITIFQSMGMGAEDATVAQAVFEAVKSTEQ